MALSAYGTLYGTLYGNPEFSAMFVLKFALNTTSSSNLLRQTFSELKKTIMDPKMKLETRCRHICWILSFSCFDAAFCTCDNQCMIIQLSLQLYIYIYVILQTLHDHLCEVREAWRIMLKGNWD